MIDVAGIALRAVGAFYAFAGVVAIRAIATSVMVERALSKLSTEPMDRREIGRLVWLAVSSIAIFWGGVSAFIQHHSAVGLFLTAAILQALYLAVAAPFFFDARDGPDVLGRQRTMNAFVLYMSATAFVLWAGANQGLHSANAISERMLTIATLAVLAFCFYALRLAWQVFSPPRSHEQQHDDIDEAKSERVDDLREP